MSNYKGQLAGFPDEIVEKMLYYQELQGNKRDVTVFENSKYAGLINDGFNYSDTRCDGYVFWKKVLNGDFNHFFEKYPKHGKYPMEITSYKTSDGAIHETIEAAEKVQKKLEFNKTIINLHNPNNGFTSEFIDLIIEHREKLHEIFKMLD